MIMDILQYQIGEHTKKYNLEDNIGEQKQPAKDCIEDKVQSAQYSGKSVCADSKGFGLIECMVSMTIFAIASLGLAQMYLHTMVARRDANHKQQSVYIAKAGIEQSVKELAVDASWRAGFNNIGFSNGKYNVTLTDPNSDPNIPSGLVEIKSVGTVGTQSTTILSRYKGE